VEEEHIVITLDVGDQLVIRRALYIKEVPVEPTKGRKSSTPNVQLKARCLTSSLMEVVTQM